MRILFVCPAESVHSVRWISLIEDQNWEIHIFPSFENGITHPQFKNIQIHHFLSWIKTFPLGDRAAGFCRRWYARFFPNHRVQRLTRLIHKLNPDLIHTMETQEAGYLVAEVKKNYKGKFPVWAHTIWGSDLNVFSKLSAHKPKIEEVLRACQFFLSDGVRDEKLAKQLGFQGKMIRLTHAAGGFNLKAALSFREKSGKSSQRKGIVLKGYQSWAGRALFGLHALERCVDALPGYTVYIYAAGSDVALAAELFSFKTGIPVHVIPPGAPDETIIDLFYKSRIFIGLSISDGVPTSMLEAMACGTFPVHSNTGILENWIVNDKNGILVPPEEPADIEKAIRAALASDELVDAAAEYNMNLIDGRFDREKIKKEAVSFYLSLNKLQSQSESKWTKEL